MSRSSTLGSVPTPHGLTAVHRDMDRLCNSILRDVLMIGGARRR